MMDKVTVQVNAPDVINITSDAGDNITLSSTAVIVLPDASDDLAPLDARVTTLESDITGINQAQVNGQWYGFPI